MDLEKIINKFTTNPDPRKIRAFHMIEMDHMTGVDTAKTLSVKDATVYAWKKEGWWQEAKKVLIKEVYREGKDTFIYKVSKNMDKVINNVVNSDANKTASAQVALVKIFTESTDEPLVQKKNGDFNVMIDNRSVGFGSVDMEKVKTAPAHIKKEIAMGNIPPEYRKEE